MSLTEREVQERVVTAPTIRPIWRFYPSPRQSTWRHLFALLQTTGILRLRIVGQYSCQKVKHKLSFMSNRYLFSGSWPTESGSL